MEKRQRARSEFVAGAWDLSLGDDQSKFTRRIKPARAPCLHSSERKQCCVVSTWKEEDRQNIFFFLKKRLKWTFIPIVFNIIRLDNTAAAAAFGSILWRGKSKVCFFFKKPTWTDSVFSWLTQAINSNMQTLKNWSARADNRKTVAQRKAGPLNCRPFLYQRWNVVVFITVNIQKLLFGFAEIPTSSEDTLG